MLAELFSDVRLWTVLAVLVSIQLLRPKKTAFPVVNHYPGDFFNRRAYRESRFNCGRLITEGLAKHQGPFSIAFPHCKKIVLPASLVGWAKNHKDLDHRELVKDEYFSGIPGFEAQTALHADDETSNRVIKTKLGQNESTVAAMNASLTRAFKLLWGNAKDWHAIDWYKDTSGIIARAASSVFVGPEKCDDTEWLELIQSYVTSYFTAVGELHAYPAWARPIAHWFLPNAARCRKIIPRTRAIMNEVISKRREEAKKAEREGRTAPEYNDAVTWMQAGSNGPIEMGDLQLSLAMAALMTTSELFRMILIDVARHPELVEPLRKEITDKISTHGLSVAAASNMVLLDSVMKESQRLGSGVVVIERMVLKDTALPDGRILPRGSMIMVDSTDLWNPAVYPDPQQFDGYRFLRKREAGDKTSQFVQSGPDYHVFGGGRHICPGRFFANNEVKFTLAHILLKYDIRLAQGCDPKPIPNNYYAMVDPTVRLEVRRRTDGAAAEVLGKQ